MLTNEFYRGREQTYVKHFVLEKYLEKLAYIVGYRPQTISFIDGFAGPWQQIDEGLGDTSPFIAISKLREAKDGLASIGRGPLSFRCFFVERDAAQCARLRAALDDVNVQTEVHEGAFEDHIPDAIRFATAGTNSFCFTFIDPTGWTGYSLRTITPLLQVGRGEVLINFMTKDIVRFVDHPDPTLEKSFVDLFGDAKYRDEWAGLEGMDRESAIVSTYIARLKAAAGYEFVTSTVVFHPSKRRTHFHLIYGTRSLKGLEVFRDVERRAFKEQEGLRDAVRQRSRRSKGQGDLFDAHVMSTGDMAGTREAALKLSRDKVESALKTRRHLQYDELAAIALAHSFTWKTDLSAWVTEWAKSGQLQLVGLQDGERTPKLFKGHEVKWL